MKIILLQDEKKLGKKGDIIEASEGYARNYILPKKIGVEATSKNMNDLKLQKANEEKVAQENLDAAKALAAELETKQVLHWLECYAVCYQQLADKVQHPLHCMFPKTPD